MFAVWLVVELVADSETIETRVDPDRGRVFPDGSGLRFAILRYQIRCFSLSNLEPVGETLGHVR